MERYDVGLQIVASISTVFAIWAGETARTTFVMSAHMSREVRFAREGAGAEWALVLEVREEWWHDLVVVSAVAFLAERLMFERVDPSGVVSLLARIKFVKFVGGKGGNAEERMEEDLRVFVVSREDGIRGERGERNVDDGQYDVWVIFSRLKVMCNGGVVFVCTTEVEVKVAATSEFSRTQGARVVIAFGMEDDDVVLAFSITDRGEVAVATAEYRLGWRHTPVGNDDFL